MGLGKTDWEVFAWEDVVASSFVVRVRLDSEDYKAEAVARKVKTAQ